jgi:hypothetical protein
MGCFQLLTSDVAYVAKAGLRFVLSRLVWSFDMALCGASSDDWHSKLKTAHCVGEVCYHDQFDATQIWR